MAGARRLAVLETGGDEQARDVVALMDARGFTRIETRPDLAGIVRFVAGGISSCQHVSIIEGGVPLKGEVAASAAKNAALPALAAALLTRGAGDARPTSPTSATCRTMLKLLADARRHGDPPGPGGDASPSSASPAIEAPYELVSTMRASVLVLGPLVARHGSARVALPGGCAIGVRPIDQHLKGLAALGAEIAIENGYVEARARRLKGARIATDLVTVTGTENLMMAAALAEGTTVIENAAREPEVARPGRGCSRRWARACTARGPSASRSRACASWAARVHRVIPDRIEAGTLLVAGAITQRRRPRHRHGPRPRGGRADKLEECGIAVEIGGRAGCEYARTAGRGRPTS